MMAEFKVELNRVNKEYAELQLIIHNDTVVASKQVKVDSKDFGKLFDKVKKYLS